MNPLIRLLIDLLGLTEEQIAKLKAEQPIEVAVGQLFMSNDPGVIRVNSRDLCRMCLHLPRPVMHALMGACTEVYQMMDKVTQPGAAKAELDRAIGDAAGEGMGTARPSPPVKSAPPSVRPWTPDDKIPN